nr:hypothetical protein [Enterococcus sp. 665A]
MTASSNAAFAGIGLKTLSKQKGLVSAQSTLSAFNALYLAERNAG